MDKKEKKEKKDKKVNSLYMNIDITSSIELSLLNKIALYRDQLVQDSRITVKDLRKYDKHFDIT